MSTSPVADTIVHIVEDEEAVRDALVWLLKSRGLPSVAYGSGEEYLQACRTRTLSAACLVVDVRMAGMSGLALFDILHAEKMLNALPVIFLTGHGDVQTLVRAIKAGAWDVVEKPFDAEPFFAAIEQALALSGRASREQEAAEALNKVAALGPQERKVLDGLMAGKPNKVIAQESGISERAVEVHRVRLIERLGIGSTAEAVRLAAMASLAIGNRSGP